MKSKILLFLKVVCLVDLLLYSNLLNSQGTCGAGYSFSVTAAAACVYTFSVTCPHSPTVTNVGWQVYSSGTYGKLCDAFSGTTVNRTFCFSGNYNVICTVTFTGGSYCTMTTNNISISCSGAPVCDPDPERVDEIPDPYVEISYICTVPCGTASAPVAGCLYETGCTPNEYCICCGYHWSIRIVPSTYNCEMFSYWIQYYDLTDSPDCGDAICTSYSLTPGIEYCINVKKGTTVYIVADGNHCCIPDGYQRAKSWVCSPSNGDFVAPPETNFGHCGGYRCPTTGDCTEYSYAIDQISGFPATGCINGKKEIFKRQNKNLLDKDAQNIIIYNLSGLILYDGKWKFGDLDQLYLEWPDNIGTGFYFIKFRNTTKNTIKIFKFK